MERHWNNGDKSGRGRSRAPRSGALPLALALIGIPALAWAWTASPFNLELDTRTLLQNLWRESVDANQERVACIGGYFDGQIFYITRAERLLLQVGDSISAAPGPSIERCGPPKWAGTAHTHIALYRGHPYATFSMSDRAVMGLWRRRWSQEGLFCVLFSETEAYCEFGLDLSGDVTYGQQRGNVILP